jgi:transposase
MCVHRGIVDTQEQALPARVFTTKNRRRTVRERREIVEETLVPGASVLRVARRHDVNANQVFYWRKLYREGRLGGSVAAQLLPVKVVEQQAAPAKWDGQSLPSGTIEIKVPRGTLRIAGSVDVVALRAVLECLTG